MKFCRFILPVFLVASLCGELCPPSIAAPENAPRLVEVGHEDASGLLVFDMGVLEQLDNAQRQEDFAKENEFFPWQPGYHRVLEGKKHIFLLKNMGTSDLTISNIQDTSLCVQTEVVEQKEGEATTVVKPGDTIGILVAFDQYLSLLGPVREQVDVFAKGVTEPVATLVMQGTVKGGIDFLEPAVDFGKSRAGTRSREFTLVFDKRVPNQMTPAPLQLVSTNPFVTFESLDEGKTVMGVAIKDGLMSFPMDVTLPQELRLRFRAVLSDNAPVGALEGQVALIMRGAPHAAITRNLSIPIKGEVTRK